MGCPSAHPQGQVGHEERKESGLFLSFYVPDDTRMRMRKSGRRLEDYSNRCCTETDARDMPAGGESVEKNEKETILPSPSCSFGE